MLKICLRSIVGALAVVAILMTVAAPSHAWSYTGTGQWASVSYGNWTVYQNEWGSSNACTLYANYYGNFASAGSWSGSGTKGYPHTQANVNLSLNSGSHDLQAGWNSSSPGGAVQDWFFDCWTSNMADEVMIIEDSNTGGSWGTQIASNVYAGWSTWSSVWQVNDGHNILLFINSKPSANSSQDVYDVMQYAYQRGWLSNSNFYQISWGVEITSGSGQWTENNFWCNYD